MDRPQRDHFPHFPYLGSASRNVDKLLQILDRIELFDGFERADVEHFATHMPCYVAPAGATIIREGEQGDFLLLVIGGIVQISKRDNTGRERQVATVGPGKTLGEMSLIDGSPRFATCVALEDSEFALLDRDTLSRIIDDEPRLGVKIMIEMVQMLSQRLRAVTSRLADHSEV